MPNFVDDPSLYIGCALILGGVALLLRAMSGRTGLVFVSDAWGATFLLALGASRLVANSAPNWRHAASLFMMAVIVGQFIATRRRNPWMSAFLVVFGVIGGLAEGAEMLGLGSPFVDASGKQILIWMGGYAVCLITARTIYKRRQRQVGLDQTVT